MMSRIKIMFLLLMLAACQHSRAATQVKAPRRMNQEEIVAEAASSQKDVTGLLARTLEILNAMRDSAGKLTVRADRTAELKKINEKITGAEQFKTELNQNFEKIFATSKQTVELSELRKALTTIRATKQNFSGLVITDLPKLAATLAQRASTTVPQEKKEQLEATGATLVTLAQKFADQVAAALQMSESDRRKALLNAAGADPELKDFATYVAKGDPKPPIVAQYEKRVTDELQAALAELNRLLETAQATK